MLNQTILLTPQGGPTMLDILGTVPLVAALTWLCIVDLRQYRLPDAGTLPLIAAGLMLAGWREQALPWDAIIGAVSAYAVFAVIGVVYFRARGVDGLGLGDAKLLAAAGSWLGWQSLPLLVLVASLIGLCAAIPAKWRIDRRIPFGPAIAVAFMVHWIVFIMQSV